MCKVCQNKRVDAENVAVLNHQVVQYSATLTVNLHKYHTGIKQDT